MLLRQISFCLMVVCLLACNGNWATAEDAAAPIDVDQAREWLVQLGDADYELREEATDHLRDLGPQVAPVLEEGLTIDDIDIRCRCERLLSEIYVLERENRINDFIAGRAREDEDELPCWSRVREILGGGEDARELYTLMMKSEWELLEKAAASEEESFVDMRERCQTIQLSYRMYQQEIPLGSIATLLFIAADDEQCPQPVGSALYSFCFQNPFAQVLGDGGKHAGELRRLLGRWIEHRENSANPYESIMLAMRYDLPEGLVPAGKLLEDATIPVQVKQLAMVTFAKLGDVSDMPVLEPFIEDESICAVMQIGEDRIETQLRDVAVVSQIYLWGEEPTAFGFDRISSSGYILFNPASVGFENDEAREEVYGKWAEFRDAHPVTADGE